MTPATAGRCDLAAKLTKIDAALRADDGTSPARRALLIKQRHKLWLMAHPEDVEDVNVDDDPKPVEVQQTALAVDEPSQLRGLAEKINEAVRDAEDHLREATLRAIQIGRDLAFAKSVVAHGQFVPWLEANVDLAPRTARAYMRLAARYEGLDHETATRVAVLPVREALRAVETPAEPTKKGPRSGYVTSANRTDAQRAGDTLIKAATALRETSRNLKSLGMLKAAKVDSLKAKLQAALTALEELEGGAE